MKLNSGKGVYLLVCLLGKNTNEAEISWNIKFAKIVSQLEEHLYFAKAQQSLFSL